MHQSFLRRCAQQCDDASARQLLLSLSRCLHEPCSTVKRLLGDNRKYLNEVERLRNRVQPSSRLDRHLASFQLQQPEELEELLRHIPGSRILVSFHFGDFIYGNSIVAGLEEPGRQQCYLTQLPATEAFLANMKLCFGADGIQRREQFLTASVSPQSLVKKLRREQCTLLTFVDLPAGFGERVGVSFLGRKAWFSKGPAVLSLASGAPFKNFDVVADDEIIASKKEINEKMDHIEKQMKKLREMRNSHIDSKGR